MKLSGITGDEVKVLLFIVGIIVLAVFARHRQEAKTPAPFIAGPEKDYESAREPSGITVDISGAVWRPGVYTLERGARVGDVLEKAMPRPDADIDRVNRAQMLADGQKIVVPSQDAPGAGDGPGGAGPVNINTATEEELTSLPGIGRVRAGEITNYRERHGPFGAVEELERIPGIGSATVERLRESISVR